MRLRDRNCKRFVVLQSERKRFQDETADYKSGMRKEEPDPPAGFFYLPMRHEFKTEMDLILISAIDTTKVMNEVKENDGGDKKGLIASSLRPEAVVQINSRNRQIVRECLKGWKNVFDETGKEIPFDLDKKTGKVPDHVLENLEPIMDELAQEISEENEYKEEDVVKSQ